MPFSSYRTLTAAEKNFIYDNIIKAFEKNNIKETNGYLSWNTKEEREFKFSKEQIDILLSIVKKLDDANEITLQNLELAKKIYEYANPANQITS